VKILVADADSEMVDLLSYWFKGYGHNVVSAFDGLQAIKRWRETVPDLVILDLHMPKLDGFEVCRQMHGETNVPILMLAAEDCEDDEIRALEMGADDYVRKPCSPRRLHARVQAIMRRSAGAESLIHSYMITAGPVTLDIVYHEMTRDGVKVRLTPKESRLLHVLMVHAGEVLLTDTVLSRVWDYDEDSNSGLVRAHIHHLRQKVEPDVSRPQLIITVPGVGYSFMASSTIDS
jgi:DNA-binding response OmpR family regulator